ncbi:MAG: 5-oxoprolinase subunit PxpB [Acidobacteriota bacterium]|nr:5-oxoprolinase subunit PxpB [Acidobacteriota bacterium]
MRIIPASDSSLLVEFGNAISPQLHGRVMTLFLALEERHDPRIRNLHPGYGSLLIDFDPLQLSHEELASILEQAVADANDRPYFVARMVTLPVCYDPEFGLDLLELAQSANLTVEQFASQHSLPLYRVYFLGFSPGFAYLGGLPEPLHAPRLATPRPRVAAGSVGIAGSQTGIYPVDSPGGWRIIGRTPMRLFSPGATQPTLLHPSDLVRIFPIDRATFEEMSREQ